MVTVPPAESIVRFPLSVSISLSPVIPTLILPAFKPVVVISALADIVEEAVTAPTKVEASLALKYPSICTSGSDSEPPVCENNTSLFVSTAITSVPSSCIFTPALPSIVTFPLFVDVTSTPV